MSRAFTHTAHDVTGLVARRLGVSVASIAPFEHGIVNAVYFLELTDGRECVVRVSVERNRDYAALELWAFAQCHALGVQVPTVLAHELDPTDFPEPFIITERVIGLLSDSADLTLDELYAAYEDLGRQLAILHGLALPGFGELRPEGDAFVGPFASWWERLGHELDGYERKLTRDGPGGRDPRAAAALTETRRRLNAHRDLFDLPAASLVHGDLQGKNFLVQAGKVAAVLDFECAEAGDPVMDFRVFRYWDAKRDALTEAMLRGYRAAGGAAGPDHTFWTRLGLYELLYALLRLAGFYETQDQPRIEDTFHRINRINRDLNRLQLAPLPT